MSSSFLNVDGTIVTNLYENNETGGHCSILRGKIHLIGCFEESVILKKYDPEFSYEALNEMRMAKKSLNHENILSYRSYSGPVDGFYFFVVPFYEVGLNTLLYQNHKIQPLKYAIELLSAISHMHKNKVVHRDLKPDNVRVNRGRIKLIDFSLCGVDGVSTFNTFEPHNMWYRAPEWFLKSETPKVQTFDSLAQADLWAAGMVIVEFDLRKPVCAGAEKNMIRFFEHLFFTCKQAPPHELFSAQSAQAPKSENPSERDYTNVYETLVSNKSLPTKLVNSLLQPVPSRRNIAISVL